MSIHSALENVSPQFTLYVKKPSIHELRTFGCDNYLITSSLNFLDYRTKELSFMGSTNSRAKMKWWYTHTNKLKYCSSEISDEHNNKFGKVWSPSSELMTGKNSSSLPTLKIDV